MHMRPAAACDCPHHPIGCYGHPDSCACADAWNDVLSAIDTLTSHDAAEYEIRTAVGTQARLLVKALRETFPAPKVWTHGPDSLVFDWDSRFMLTVEAQRITGQIGAVVHQSLQPAP